jgi:hypothetical protein
MHSHSISTARETNDCIMINEDDDHQDARIAFYSSSSASRLPYIYAALSEEAQEIRLLTILPSAFASDVHVTLQTHVFAKNIPLQYEALSYTWGSPKVPVDIFVGSPYSRGTISVTQNLAEALRYLRYEDKIRILWIDAICVNQLDMAERSSQVKRMADIYSAASRVVVWLGPESDDSTMAMGCCQLISSNITVDWVRQAMSPVSTDTHWANKEEPLPFCGMELAAISRLLDRDWFKRLWIWQEVNLAAEVIVLCGTNTLSWMVIQDAVFSIYVKSWAQYHNIKWSHRRLLHSLCKGPKGLSLDKLIENTKHSLCSDSRDRIFALFSLLSAYDRLLTIEPDYSKPAAQIFEDFTRHYIQGRKHLKILSTIETQDQHSELPSWIPNWSTPRITTPFTRTKFSGLSQASAKFRVDACLEVCGRTIGTIEMTEPFRLPNPGSRESTSRNVSLELQRIASVLNLDGLLDDDSQSLARLCRVLCANSVLKVISSPIADYLSFQDATNSLREALRFTTEDLGSDATVSMKPFINSVLVNCYGRSLYRCLDGTIGLASKFARLGDKVAVLLGCDTAMVLRPFRENQYRLLGEAVYDGAMDGSAFLGSLPERFQLVLMVVERRDEEDIAWAWRFLHRDTGIVSAEDPRLVDIELPLGWRRTSYTEGEFLNDETRERTMYDPRLTAEFLKSRGVALEIFEIV